MLASHDPFPNLNSAKYLQNTWQRYLPPCAAACGCRVADVPVVARSAVDGASRVVTGHADMGKALFLCFVALLGSGAIHHVYIVQPPSIGSADLSYGLRDGKRKGREVSFRVTSSHLHLSRQRWQACSLFDLGPKYISCHCNKLFGLATTLPNIAPSDMPPNHDRTKLDHRGNSLTAHMHSC